MHYASDGSLGEREFVADPVEAGALGDSQGRNGAVFGVLERASCPAEGGRRCIAVFLAD
jgi:hypothetical protein